MPRDFFQEYPAYFFTGRVVGWLDVFTRDEYSQIFMQSCNFCTEQFGLKVHSFVLMPSHFHMLASTDGKAIGKIVQSLKSFTAKRIIQAIETNPQESRRAWLLSGFRNSANRLSKGQVHQFWQHRSYPSPLWSPQRIGAAMDYIHQNPVKAGYVAQPSHWLYSSAIDYEGRRGEVKIDLVDSVWVRGW